MGKETKLILREIKELRTSLQSLSSALNILLDRILFQPTPEDEAPTKTPTPHDLNFRSYIS